MARYLIVRPGIVYRSAAGYEIFAGPAYGPHAAEGVLDTDDASRDLPAGWQPPVIGVEAMDAAAQAALDAVRQPYAGAQWPGVGYVTDDTPIWSP